VAPASGVDDDREATLEFRVVCRDNLGGGVCSSSGLGLDGPAVTALHGRPSGVAAAVGSGVVPALAECQALSTLRDRSSVGQEGQAVAAAAVDSVGVDRGPPPLDGPPSPPPRVPSTLAVSPPVAAGEPDEGARRMLVGSGPVKTCGEVRLESPKSSNNAEDVAGTGTSDDDDDDDGENLRRVRE